MARSSGGGNGIDMGAVIIGGLAIFLIYQFMSNSALSSALAASSNPGGLTVDQYPTGTMYVGPTLQQAGIA